MSTNTATPLMQDLRDARQLLQDVRDWQTNDELLTFGRQIVLFGQVEQSLDALLTRFDPPTPPPGNVEDTWLVSMLAELQKQRDVCAAQAAHVGDYAVEEWRRGYYYSAAIDFVTAFRIARATLAFEEALALLTVALVADAEDDA